MPGKKYIVSLPDGQTGLHRRKFLSNTIKIAVLGSLLPASSCSNKSEKSKENPDSTGNKSQPGTKNQKGKNSKRKSWNHEGLVMNSKTKVLHLPTRKVYTYYDEIQPGHLQQVGLATWASQLDGPARLNRDQSGNIIEILAMQDLKQGVNEGSLNAGINTVSKAFDRDCENSKGINSNINNFRLHELMLQLIALNNSIPLAEKWNVFNAKTKRPSTLRRRQAWMENETNFNDRVKYILDRQNDYITRLGKRAAKYSIS